MVTDDSRTSPQTSHRARAVRPVLVLLGGALLAGCVTADLEPAAPEVAEAAEELICGAENWNDFQVFSGNASYRVGAQYGRAVASIPGCSASLVAPSKLLTANHCYNGPTTTAVFGVGWNGSAYARQRIQDLGASASVAGSVAWAQLSRFTCTRETTFSGSSWGRRDVDVYECQPNAISGLGNVFPGDIWGYLEAQAGSRDEGSDMYVMSVNKASFYTGSRVLLSPGGEIEDELDGCITGGDYDNCFEHDADTLGGSSGGPILDANHRVFGVVHGNWDIDVSGQKNCPSLATNYGAYLPGSGFLTSWVTSDPLPSPAQTATTAWAGGAGGSLATLVCPTGSLAAGVVGTTYAFDAAGNARVGNLGLVCVPYKQVEDSAVRPTSQWRVLAGGSYDTILGAWSYEFNEYMREWLDLFADGGGAATFADQQQSLAMCRPGFYLTGIKLHSSQYIDKVVEIECSAYHKAAWIPVRPSKPIGTRSSTERIVRCPDTTYPNRLLPDRAVYGIRLRAGWLADGFEMLCRRF